MRFNKEKEVETLLERLEKSNKIFAASVATESEKVKEIFPIVKERFPEAMCCKAGRVIYLIARKNQRGALIKHLLKRKEEYEEVRESGKCRFGEDESMVKEALQEITEALQTLKKENTND